MDHNSICDITAFSISIAGIRVPLLPHAMLVPLECKQEQHSCYLICRAHISFFFNFWSLFPDISPVAFPEGMLFLRIGALSELMVDLPQGTLLLDLLDCCHGCPQ